MTPKLTIYKCKECNKSVRIDYLPNMSELTKIVFNDMEKSSLCSKCYKKIKKDLKNN